jgi:hypothetical protein
VFSAEVDQVAEALRGCERGEVLALFIPHQNQRDRAKALDHHAKVVTELRAADWRIRTELRPCPDGEIYSLELLAPPPTEGGQP